VPEGPEALLSERESRALAYFRNSKQAALAPSLNAKLFELWLNGCDCAEIHRLNDTLSLGQIVNARVMGEWDRRRDEHAAKLLEETAGRFRQVTLESVGFVADMLAAANKLHGDSFKRYLQSGNPSDLPALAVDSLAAYQKAVDLMMKLTGQDKQSKVVVEATHRVEAARQPLNAAESASNLKRLRGR
jgi:hypothetical protein